MDSKNILIKKTLVILVLILFLNIVVYPSTAKIFNDIPSSIQINGKRIIYVDDDNTEGPWEGTEEHPFRRVRDGVDAAEDGDTVFIKNGYYHQGYFHVDESITILGEDRDSTIIEGYGSTCGFDIWADSVRIYNLTLQNYISVSGGFAINIHSENNIICGNRIIGCQGYGLIGGINNKITDNLIFNNGVGIKAFSKNIIMRNIVENNNYFGISVGIGSNLVALNHVTNNGGGIQVYTVLEFDRKYCPIGKPFNIIIKNNIFSNEIDAYFENYIFNYWRKNYWHQYEKPKVIKGMIWWSTVVPDQIVERNWINFDWRPAKEPYDIGI